MSVRARSLSSWTGLQCLACFNNSVCFADSYYALVWDYRIHNLLLKSIELIFIIIFHVLFACAVLVPYMYFPDQLLFIFIATLFHTVDQKYLH